MLEPKPPIGARLRARALTRPRALDAVMVVAAALSYGYHTAGITLLGLAVLFIGWIILWTRWVLAKAGPVGAAASLLALSLMLFGPRWQLGFEVTRGCFDDKATAALASVEPDADLGQPVLIDEAGRCGPVTYRTIEVIAGRTYDRSSDAMTRSVWFQGAGITRWDLFGGNGFVYSPGAKPWCEQRIVGDVHGCWLSDLGDGWYAYEYDSNIS